MKLSWGKWGLAARGAFAAENAAYNSYSGNYTNEDGSYNYGATTFGGDAYAYYNLGNKIHNGDDLSVSDVTMPIAMSFAFVGSNIHQLNENTHMIPKNLRRGAANLNTKARGLFRDIETIDGMKKGSQINEDVRQWYLDKEKQSYDLIDQSLSKEQRAREAFEYRNKIRYEARELMIERKLADRLNETNPNMTWEQVNEKYQKQGYEGDALHDKIYESSTKSRQSVNEKLGTK